MKKVVCVIGRSGSGKDWIANQLGYNMVVSYTTREKRDNETNGKEHWFITKEEMQCLLHNNDVIAYTKIGEYEYCATLDCLSDITVYIIDPKGLQYLKEYFSNKLDIYTVYVYCDENIRTERVKTRSDFATKFAERNKAENEQFAEFEKQKSWDLLIDNSKNTNISNVRKNIKKLLEGEQYANN